MDQPIKLVDYPLVSPMTRSPLRLSGPPPLVIPIGFNYHVLTLPLLHIFSVSVHVDHPSQIYGSIRATELDGISFHIYDRPSTEPETIFDHGTLSLIGPDKDPILGGITGVTIDVSLKDGNTTSDIELIKGQFYLDPTSKDIETSYDKLTKYIIQSEHGSACFYYITFRFAVYAVVEVTITETRDKSSSFADVYGSVVASYGNSTQFCTSDDESKYLDTVLFEKPSGEPMRVMVGTPVKLLRSVVVVPVYSPLVIKANISDTQGQLANDILAFCVLDFVDYTESIKSENGCVQVKVRIRDAYPRIYDQLIYKCCTTTETKAEETPQNENAYIYELLPPSFESGGSSPLIYQELKFRGCPAVELFSVFVGGFSCELSTICGTIRIDDGHTPFYFYESEWNDLDDDKMLCIQANQQSRNYEFRLFVDLKDPIQKIQVSEGIISWNAGSLVRDLRGPGYFISWFHKRICSVLPSAHGYAAFHYMIFNSAVSAFVEVTFFSDNCVGAMANVYGVILARYGGYEYSTDYDKKYYQSRLFKRSQKNAEQLNTNSRIPLPKSVVAVHVNSSLIVEANLRVIYNGNSHEEVLFGDVEFTVDMSGKFSKKIQGECCYIEVSIKWAY